ncbi:nuclear transport factor 2 family protein [Methylocystis sp. JAN1]|uniref:nuclear transport factor 2 family protein n=1 Tax=Methylocystis sp. JAN1 TaxID=3397211 RepID=UPI003FA2E052
MYGGGNRTVRLTAADKRRLIAEMLECRMRRRYDRFQTYVDPLVVVYCNAWREGIIGPEVWAGAPAVRDLFRRTDENYFPLDHEILDIVVDDDRAAVRWRGYWRRHATSKVYPIDAAHFLRWDNGLVVEMHEFFDAQCKAPSPYAALPGLERLLAPSAPELTRAEMERRVRRLVGEESAPEPELLRQWCSPNIVCEFVGDRARLPYAGRHVGVEAMLGIVRAVNVDFEQCNFAVSEMMIEDARVCGRRRVHWRHRGTGRAGISELADFVRFENGLVVELIEFRDTVSLALMGD